MIGPTKLSAIREQLRGAIAATVDDPLKWLEERFSAPKGSVPSGSGQSEVLESLQRILVASDRGKGRKRRAAAKK